MITRRKIKDFLLRNILFLFVKNSLKDISILETLFLVVELKFNKGNRGYLFFLMASVEKFFDK